MKSSLITIAVIVILVLIGSPVLMWAMRVTGMLTGHALG